MQFYGNPGTSVCLLSACGLPCWGGGVESLQGPSGGHSLTYVLSGTLQDEFADP